MCWLLLPTGPSYRYTWACLSTAGRSFELSAVSTTCGFRVISLVRHFYGDEISLRWYLAQSKNVGSCYYSASHVLLDPALTARSTAASRQTKRFSDWAHSRASGCQTVSGKMGAGLQTVPCLHLPRERHANQGALVGRLDLAIRLPPPCTA